MGIWTDIDDMVEVICLKCHERDYKLVRCQSDCMTDWKCDTCGQPDGIILTGKHIVERIQQELRDNDQYE